jgi:hypothetical protein
VVVQCSIEEMPKQEKAQKDVMSVQLTPESRRVIEQLSSVYISQKTKLVERVLTWFAGQPTIVQHFILTPIPEGMHGIYAAMLEAMARELKSGLKGEAQLDAAAADALLRSAELNLESLGAVVGPDEPDTENRKATPSHPVRNVEAGGPGAAGARRGDRKRR